MTEHFGTNQVISSVEVYDKHIITCHFSYHTLLSALVHISSIEHIGSLG
jgi:hypothetical protein